MSVADRLASVRLRIANACKNAGRDPKHVELVAVSKTHDADAIRKAYAAGQRHFGENYAQEFEDKARALADLEDIVWHFIGNLQSNKAKLVAEHAHFVHTIDRARIAQELSKRRVATGLPSLRVFIEVNVANEPQKHGCLPNDVESLVTEVRSLDSLALVGLMTVPPIADGENDRAFAALAARAREAKLTDLSMGMSDDLETAIAHGATFVRIGTAIFGARG